MTITYNTIKQIYDRNYGSERLYKRPYCNNLNYTEGLMDFQQTLNAYWIVENIISYMPEILRMYKENDFTFFVVEIALKQDKQGYMELYTEGYVDEEYKEHILIQNQMIPYIDLPTKSDEDITTYRFFLELSSFEPVKFTLLLPTEH